ncbi:I78 family peptidase inhibitor [Aurantiacibacter gilvus]|uniref:I78 family peptidase inhibitor n=1 Tax=Aurantiacibacter gilvus TaxID=3139141 RepID=A0ABU9IFU5_9SPHN
MKLLFLPCLLLPLAACATTADGNGPPPVREPAGECDASAVQDHVGHTASAEAGATLLRLTGAATLRWVPPRTAVTMDFRPDRLTVSYDDDMIIERITCG